MRFNPEIHAVVDIFVFEEDGKVLVGAKDIHDERIDGAVRLMNADKLPLLFFQLLDVGYAVHPQGKDERMTSYQAASREYIFARAAEYMAENK